MNTWVSFQSAEQPLLGQFSVSGNKDASKRKSLSLAEYQRSLIAIMQAPSVQVGRVEYDSWWKNLLLRAKIGDIHLLLPGLDTAAFLAPLAGKASHQLNIGAYRINTILIDRAQTTERWEILSEPVVARLRRVEDNQVVLCVGYPETNERIVGKSREELNRPGFSRHSPGSLRNAFQTLPVTADC
ncbi:hypothetical protein [Pseudomonas prosekii]|uniref:hypothetical protein n=1 Tax=Pseudomonas prosekii TaxID=1148509 RepID=UPI001428C6D3|nr:hypothetical protein [Pseudomonas prosekii]